MIMMGVGAVLTGISCSLLCTGRRCARRWLCIRRMLSACLGLWMPRLAVARMRRCVLLIWWFWVQGWEDDQKVGGRHGRSEAVVVGGGCGLGCSCCKCVRVGSGEWRRLKLPTSILKGKVEECLCKGMVEEREKAVH